MITGTSFRTLQLTLTLPGAPRQPVTTQNVGVHNLAQAAIMELSQNAPSFLGMALFFDNILLPSTSELRWLGSGPGIGREIRRAMSALFGRFVARWYAHFHLGIISCLAIDKDDLIFDLPNGSHVIAGRKSGLATGDRPDWVWFTNPGTSPPVGFLEAKGSFYRAGLRKAMANADDQLKRMEIRSSGSSRRIMASKNWAIGSGWSTEVSIKGGFIRPELKVVDPIEEGENWTPDESAALLTLAMRMQLQQSLDGLGMSNVAKKLVPDGGAPESDRPPGYPGRTGRWRTDGADGKPFPLINQSTRSDTLIEKQNLCDGRRSAAVCRV
jgi:hypothetical protein